MRGLYPYPSNPAVQIGETGISSRIKVLIPKRVGFARRGDRGIRTRYHTVDFGDVVRHLIRTEKPCKALQRCNFVGPGIDISPNKAYIWTYEAPSKKDRVVAKKSLNML